jgi:dihydrofolate reductase
MSTTIKTPLPRFNVIAAMANDRVIGMGNAMPWHVPADLKRFKALTMGHRLIMGRKTFESIGRPLPGRETVVISRSGHGTAGVVWVKSLAEALALPAAPDQQVFVAGGGQIYALALSEFSSRISTMYLTLITLSVAGDAWFPAFDWAQWQIEKEEAHVHEATPPLSYRFIDLVPA